MIIIMHDSRAVTKLYCCRILPRTLPPSCLVGVPADFSRLCAPCVCAHPLRSFYTTSLPLCSHLILSRITESERAAPGVRLFPPPPAQCGFPPERVCKQLLALSVCYCIPFCRVPHVERAMMILDWCSEISLCPTPHLPTQLHPPLGSLIG